MLKKVKINLSSNCRDSSILGDGSICKDRSICRERSICKESSICEDYLIQNNCLINNDYCRNAFKYERYFVNYLLANYCMPTLYHVKPSNLIHVDKRKLFDSIVFLRILECELQPFHIGITILYEDNNMLILLLYYSELLNFVINCSEKRCFFKRVGYEVSNNIVLGVIETLQQRYKEFKEDRKNRMDFDGSQMIVEQTSHKTGHRSDVLYPHEIGVILGYPLWDVEDFIRYNGKNYIICGYWKVYHEADNALKTFCRYNQLREMG